MPPKKYEVDGYIIPEHKISRVVEMASHRCPGCNRQFEIPKKYIQVCPWCHALLPTEKQEYKVRYNVGNDNKQQQEGGE